MGAGYLYSVRKKWSSKNLNKVRKLQRELFFIIRIKRNWVMSLEYSAINSVA
jgi:hypothetical protein